MGLFSKSKKDIPDPAREKLKKLVEDGFIDQAIWFCKNKYPDRFWPELAQLYHDKGDYLQASNVYREQLADPQKEEEELLLLARSGGEKEFIVSLYENRSDWKKLAELYHDTCEFGKAEQVYKDKLNDNATAKNERKALAEHHCEKGNHAEAAQLYAAMGLLLEEAVEYDHLGFTGKAAKYLEENQHLNREKYRKAAARFWKKIGWLSRAAELLKTVDNIASMGLVRIESMTEEQVDVSVSRKAGDMLKVAKEEGKAGAFDQYTFELSGEKHLIRISAYEENVKIGNWKAKIAECYYNAGKKDIAEKMLGELGLTIEDLMEYTGKYGIYGKKNRPESR